jgi:hypothetical protein
LFFKESASLYIHPSGSYIYYGGSGSSLGKQESFGENSTIELELNTKTKTLHFFVNKIQVPHHINNINTTPLLFGISGYNSSSSVEGLFFLIMIYFPIKNNNPFLSFSTYSFLVISLLKLPKETLNNSISSTPYTWK